MKELSISKNSKILILAPHADDEAIGCGGLLQKFGSQIDVILLTDGRFGATNVAEEEVIKTRRDEFINAMEFAGVNSYQLLNISDRALGKNYNEFKKINFEKYDYVFIPNKYEGQRDHKFVFPFLLKRNLKKNIIVGQYEVWTPMLKPTHYVDMSNNFDWKRKLISYYKSQNKHHDYAYYIEGLNSYRGIFNNLESTECYNLEYYKYLKAENSFFSRIINIQKNIEDKKIFYIFGIKIKI